jgi:hypothetical protein
MSCYTLSDFEDGPRSVVQHAVILILRRFFAMSQRVPQRDILCFAQDPQYEEADKIALAEVGVSVVDHPRGFLKVDDSSLVFAICPGVQVRQIVADIARPAVMIWHNVGEYEPIPR